jgi:hypothetical protein
MKTKDKVKKSIGLGRWQAERRGDRQAMSHKRVLGTANRRGGAMLPVRGELENKEMQNSGNEAKKCLKTKDITLLNAANYARFARNLTQIGH